MDQAALRAETEIRRQFVGERVTRPLSSGERKDLTDFFHNERADLLKCENCRLLVRVRHERPPANDYTEDRYDPAAIEQVYPDYVRAFRVKETPYRSLLPQGARVLELGSHYGAFLETAAAWGWTAVGVDVGEDAARFARSRGCDVRICDLSDCNFTPSSFDGLFIWNCFDQIEQPRPVLAEAARILKPDGLLVVRTPNGLFYLLCQSFLKSDISHSAAQFLLEAMAYNNLLGFPYQYGYNQSNLQLLIEPFGFRTEGMLNSELLTLPLPEHPPGVAAEERSIRKGVDLLERSVLRSENGDLTGPWIEIWFRKAGARLKTVFPSDI
jgi:SAM-dependent methyltransferase